MVPKDETVLLVSKHTRLNSGNFLEEVGSGTTTKHFLHPRNAHCGNFLRVVTRNPSKLNDEIHVRLLQKLSGAGK